MKSIFEKIANYFSNWDGEDEDITDIKLSTQDLRDIAALNSKHVKLESKINDTKTDATENIKMCPFCGGIPKIIYTGYYSCCIECSKCGVRTKDKVVAFDDKELDNLIDIWNNRV